MLPRYVVWAVFRAFGRSGATPLQVARCVGDAGLVPPRAAAAFVRQMLAKLRPVRGRRRVLRRRADGRYIAVLLAR